MLYEPQPFFNVQNAIGQAFINAIARFAADYVRGENQPWQYYLGYGFGGAALATGIPGAQAILYVVGSGTLKIFFEKHPGAATARVFLDGVQQGDLDLVDEAIDIFEYIVNLPQDGQVHSLSILNLGSIGQPSPTNFLSILGIEAASGVLAERQVIPMAVFIVSASIRDAKTLSTPRVRNVMTVPIFVPTGALTLAQITAYHDAFLAAVDDITGGVIQGSQIIVQPTLPAGLKTVAAANSDVQEGGLFSFNLGTGYKEAVRVPAFSQALFGADGQSIPVEGVAAVEAFVDLLTGQAAAPNNFAASDRNGNLLVSLSSARKSFRK